MTCTRRFMNFQWEHHRWRRRVTAAEILTIQEPDMWARPVYRDYVRCDKEEVCEDCGKVRWAISCQCDMARGEACKLRREYLAASNQASA